MLRVLGVRHPLGESPYMHARRDRSGRAYRTVEAIRLRLVNCHVVGVQCVGANMTHVLM